MAQTLVIFTKIKKYARTIFLLYFSFLDNKTCPSDASWDSCLRRHCQQIRVRHTRSLYTTSHFLRTNRDPVLNRLLSSAFAVKLLKYAPRTRCKCMCILDLTKLQLFVCYKYNYWIFCKATLSKWRWTNKRKTLHKTHDNFYWCIWQNFYRNKIHQTRWWIIRANFFSQ